MNPLQIRWHHQLAADNHGLVGKTLAIASLGANRLSSFVSHFADPVRLRRKAPAAAGAEIPDGMQCTKSDVLLRVPWNRGLAAYPTASGWGFCPLGFDMSAEAPVSPCWGLSALNGAASSH